MELRLSEVDVLREQIAELNAELKAAEYAIRFLLADRNIEKPGFTEDMLSKLDGALGELHAEQGHSAHAADFRAAVRSLLAERHLIAAPPSKPWWRPWR